MADTPDLGQTPIFYPEGFTTAVSNGDSSSSSGAGASSSSLGLASSQELLTSEKHPEPAPKVGVQSHSQFTWHWVCG